MGMKVIITEQHLDAAITARDTPGWYHCTDCVIGQALKPQWSFIWYAGGLMHNHGSPDLKSDQTTRELEALFDQYAYDHIRALLPHEAEFREGGA